jgi:hypothetical protein
VHYRRKQLIATQLNKKMTICFILSKIRRNISA